MYTNISDNELVQYHGKIKVNRRFKLDDILDDNTLFIVKEHATGIYKIVPLFNFETISSTNPQDKVIDNKCIISIYDADTVISFITNTSFEDFDILTNTVEKWGQKIFYGVGYEKTQLTPVKGAEVTIELLDDGNVISTTVMISNENGEFVHFITGSYDNIRVTVSLDGITHSKTI